MSGPAGGLKIARPFVFIDAMTVPSRTARNQPKGQQTKAAIVDAALGLAAQVGLEGLSIGVIAELMSMSKSGVFAHFGSREELQIAVVREYARRFEDEVFQPALARPRGLPRLRAMFERWMQRTSDEAEAGCLYISGAVEFDDRPGPVRDVLLATLHAWQGAVRRAIELAVEAGDLVPDTDPGQLAFEIHGLILALHFESRFLRHPMGAQRARQGFERLLTDYAPATHSETAHSP